MGIETKYNEKIKKISVEKCIRDPESHKTCERLLREVKLNIKIFIFQITANENGLEKSN